MTFVIGSMYRSERSSGPEAQDKASEVHRAEPKMEQGIGGSSQAARKHSPVERAGAGHDDDPTRLAEGLGDPDPVKRSLAFARILENLDAENAEFFFHALKEKSATGEQMRVFLFAWGSVDPDGAMRFATSNFGGEDLEDFQSLVLTGWASADPQGAIEWVGRLEDADVADPDRRARVMRESLIHGLAANDIDLATEFVFKSGDERSVSLTEDLANQMLRQVGFNAALNWGENLPPGELKAAALDQVAYAFTDRDLVAASEWAEKYAGDDWAAKIVSRVAEEWAEEDSAASIAWLETLPQGEGRNKASFTAVREWARRDALAASDYISRMDHTPSRDFAVMALVHTIAHEDPSAAAAWANEIADTEMRADALKRTVQVWRARDADAARAWMDANGIGIEDQE